MKSRLYPWLTVAAVLALFAFSLTRGMAKARAHRPTHGAAASRSMPFVQRRDGQVTVYLNPKMQAHLAIRKAPLHAARGRKQMTLPAMVLPVQKLASMVSAYNVADARLLKAEITAAVAKHEYQRLEKLYRDQQNVSQKAVQAAQGVYRSDNVDVHLARENASVAGEAVLQDWGPVVTRWMQHNTSQIQRVLQRRDALIEMTLPTDASFAAPAQVEFRLPAGGRAYARLVSSFPQVDPRVQGVGYLYLTRTRAGLAPGFNLITHFGIGALRKGVIVPSSAVVWWQGKAWAYVAQGPDGFVRHRVSTSIPTSDGWFMANGFQPGVSVVTRDAQQILAVELTATPAQGKAQQEKH